jgi:hypothetical protein
MPWFWLPSAPVLALSHSFAQGINMNRENFKTLVQTKDVRLAADYAFLAGVPLAQVQLWLRTM